jgi:hypothetical protein
MFHVERYFFGSQINNCIFTLKSNKRYCMFKASSKDTQLDLFGSIAECFKGTAHKQFHDQQGWHNMFREHIVNRVDENTFKCLFNERMGAPNAPIRVLIGMMSLKEGFGWSDSELFERCRFDLLVRSALGLFNINDSLPTESTYYLFRKRIHDYQTEHEVDLVKLAFQKITQEQAQVFEVSGRSIRMDSKLIGSNIAWCSRYELVHDTLTMFYKAMKPSVPVRLSAEDMDLLAKIACTAGKNVVYYSSSEDVRNRLSDLGVLCYKILSVYNEKDNKHYLTLKRLFDDHFRMDSDGQTEPKPSAEIEPTSIQSPFDPDSAYRNKSGTQVKGFSVNVTETCDDGSLNLITDIQVDKANQPDTAFVQPSVENTAQVTGRNPDALYADGAYHSKDNVKFCATEAISANFTGMQGKLPRYDLELNGDQLTVIDKLTGEITEVNRGKSGKWRIQTESGHRYFTQEQIDNSKLRRKIEAMPANERKKRNNVEATIFQISYHTRKDKTRYRGLIKHRMWAMFRGLWVNLRRIVVYVEQLRQRTLFSNQSSTKTGQHLQFFTIMMAYVAILSFNRTPTEIIRSLSIKSTNLEPHFS